MTEEKKETERDVVWKQKKKLEALTWGLLLGAVAIILAGAFVASNFSLINDRHITNPDIAYKDRENLTYSWTAKELESKFDQFIPWIFTGLGVFVAGEISILAAIGDKKFHRTFCKGDTQWKYCPECGLRLSRLEKD